MSRTVLYADDGMVLTDGKVYGTTIYLAESADATSFSQISVDEYNAMRESEQAEVTDYESALAKLGVE